VELFSLAGIPGFVCSLVDHNMLKSVLLHPTIENCHQRPTSSQHQEHPGAKVHHVHENFSDVATQIETNNT